MEFKKVDLQEINRCYTVSHVILDNQSSFIFSSDGPNAQGIMFNGENFSNQEVIWENKGGCMSIKQIPNKKNELLVILEFYLGESPSFSKIVWFKKEDGQWKSKDLYHIPFIHRMDIVEIDGKSFVICATIAHFKYEKSDWNLPGAVYTFELPCDFEEDFDIRPRLIFEGLHKNHGYYNDSEQIYFSGEEGIVELFMPSDDISTWSTEYIYSKPVSDLIKVDLNGDGIKELVVIDGFHGNQLRILEHDNQNGYIEVYRYTNGAEVIHGLSSTSLNGVDTLFVGARKGTAELFAVRCTDGKYQKILIDEGFGPINITATSIQNQIILAAANHTTNLATIYVQKQV